MPRAEAGTPKAIANAMKSKGLQRLRWYCQVCQKQCRDENGFKCHAASETHLRQMLVVGESAGKHISDFSMQFQSEFVTLLSRRFGTSRVPINKVYQEYIADKHHVHMNSTRWVTLTEFCKHLGRTGMAHVDETEKGWFIAWIDSSPKALAKAAASQKKERATMSDEQRERMLIAEQIERAAAEEPDSPSSSTTPPAEEGLKREEGTEKVVLSLSAKPIAPKTVTTAPIALKIGTNPLKSNPLKRSNPFKTASTTGATEGKDKKPAAVSISAAEKLILEDQERKRRRLDKESV